jgi:imidazolonepropionase-like amidohydrolase
VSQGARPIAIVGVTVVDPATRSVDADSTVIIRSGEIADVGVTDGSAPADAEVIDGRGRYLIPGLWDFHFHGAEDNLELLRSFGVTGVRELGPAPGAPALRDEIAAGRRAGPRVVVGYPVDGETSVIDWVTEVRDEATARAAAREAKKSGADFVKVISFIGRDVYFAIAEESRRIGIPFAGHVPYSVTAAEAAEAGQATIEHLTGMLHGGSAREAELLAEFASIRRGASSLADWMGIWMFHQSRRLLDSQEPDRRARLFDLFAEHGTRQVPTLVLLRDWAHFDDLPHRDDPRHVRLPPSGFFAGIAAEVASAVSGDERAATRQRYSADLDLVRGMHEAGVRIVAGTDLAPSLPPGAMLHDELRELVKAGLEPMDALGAATINAAEAAGLDRVGRIQRGAVADLVLLNDDPLANIGSSERIEAVVANGRLLKRDALDGLIATAEASWQAASVD